MWKWENSNKAFVREMGPWSMEKVINGVILFSFDLFFG